MRVLLSTYGSRGDVQPLVALGLALQSIGVEPLVSAPADAEFIELLGREGVSLAPAFMPVRQWIEQARQSGLRLPQLAAKMVPAQLDAIAAAAEGCDAIVATGLFPSVAAAQSVAESWVSILAGRPFAHSWCRHHITRPWNTPAGRTRQK